MRFLVFVSCLFVFYIPSFSAEPVDGGYRIEVELQHFEGDTLLLGYYFGKSQFLKDTAAINRGKFVFEGKDDLKPGVYLLVIPPDNKFIHVIVTKDQSRFSMYVDLKNIVNSAQFKGSPESEIYYDYLRELDKRRPQADTLKKRMVDDSLQKSIYLKQIEKLDAEVRKVQDDIIARHPSSMTAMLILANRDITLPEFNELSEEDRKHKQIEYYRQHYFDNLDLADPCTMRSGMIHPKIDYYLQKLTYPYPDSQIVAIDYLLHQMGDTSEAFQFYLAHFLNEAARSKKMGMDAVYVHLIDNYYAKGRATWTQKEQLDKLMSQAETVRPLLIGKTAPELTFFKESGEPVSIHSIQSDYTVLFFWDPECGHCKKSMPAIVEFYNEYKNKGVQILAICTKSGQDISSCWSTIRERGMDIWVNAADQYIRNRYKTIYDVKTTPQIFILDKDKMILIKKIAGEDLKTVMDEIMKSKLTSSN